VLQWNATTPIHTSPAFTHISTRYILKRAMCAAYHVPKRAMTPDLYIYIYIYIYTYIYRYIYKILKCVLHVTSYVRCISQLKLLCALHVTSWKELWRLKRAVCAAHHELCALHTKSVVHTSFSHVTLGTFVTWLFSACTIYCRRWAYNMLSTPTISH